LIKCLLSPVHEHVRVLISDIQEILPCILLWERENPPTEDFRSCIDKIEVKKFEKDPTKFIEKVVSRLQKDDSSVILKIIRNLD
jgi:hypothetical protein